MTSAASNPNQANQPTLQINNAASPPSKRDLKSWWKGFKLPSKHQEPQVPKPGILKNTFPTQNYGMCNARSHKPAAQMVNPSSYIKSLIRELLETRPQGIFGVPLRQSITYANVAISLIDEKGQSYIYGYVPIVVAKCGVFLKEKATHIEGIFRLSGSEKRIKELKTIFDSPDRYGKGLVWDGYTVHDAANVLRRYLNDLPEPVVPLDLYEKFRDPLRGATKQAVGDAEGPQFVENFNEKAAIVQYQQLITELPPLNRQLLLYILDLLAVFAAKADENRMNSQNLAAIFQPGMLSHPAHAMAPEEYRLNQCVIIFLIENQDHFLIGMQGTAADEKTKKEVESGTPRGPLTPQPARQTSLGRSASNASAGANSVRRDGKLRRNRSASSRNSRNDGSSTPNSPALTATPTTGGLARSNTVPSKKSPAIGAGRFQRPDGSSPRSGAHLEPLTQVNVTENIEESPQSTRSSEFAAGGYLTPSKAPVTGRSHEKLLEVPHESPTAAKGRDLAHIFRSIPNTDGGDKRQPNKLKKKRIPGSLNPSAQSSAASLTYTHGTSTSPGLELSNPMDHPQHYDPEPQALQQHPAPVLEERHQEALEERQHQQQLHEGPQVQTVHDAQLAPNPLTQQKSNVSSEHTPRASQASSNQSLHPDNTLKSKKSPPTSLHSSFNEGSDLDQILDEQSVSTVDQAEREKKRRWRLSRSRNADSGSSAGLTSPRLAIGQNDNGDVSNLSISSSSHRPRKSESSDRPYMLAEAQGSFDQGRESDSKGPIGWIRNKYREAKESAEQRRAKSPPPADRPGLGAPSFSPRGKSLEIKRDEHHGSLAAIAGAPAVASTNTAAAGPTMVPAPVGVPAPQTATVTMVQPEITSPVHEPHVEAQTAPTAQPAAQIHDQMTPVQDQPQSPTQPQSPAPAPAPMESPKPQAQKIRSMLDVDSPPVSSPLQSPTSPSAPAPTNTQLQAQQESNLPPESQPENKSVEATEQTSAASPVQLEQPQTEQQHSKPEAETEIPK